MITNERISDWVKNNFYCFRHGVYLIGDTELCLIIMEHDIVLIDAVHQGIKLSVYGNDVQYKQCDKYMEHLEYLINGGEYSFSRDDFTIEEKQARWN